LIGIQNFNIPFEDSMLSHLISATFILQIEKPSTVGMICMNS